MFNFFLKTMYIKQLFLSAIIAIVLLSSPNNSSAQFVNGHSYLGPHLTFASETGGSFILGANFEAPITQPGTAGPGMFAIAVRGDLWFATGGPYFFAAALANYHLKLDDSKIDPLFGLGVSFVGPGSQFFVAFNAGGRYFLNSGLAFRALLGSEWSVFFFTFGVDWTL